LTLSSVEPPHEASQLGHGGGLKAVGRASSSNQGGAGGTGFRDRLVAVDGSSGKAHATDRVECTPLNTELMPKSHEKSNSSVIEVILLKTLIGFVRRVCNCLTVPRGNLRVDCNHHHIFNCKFLQNIRYGCTNITNTLFMNMDFVEVWVY